MATKHLPDGRDDGGFLADFSAAVLHIAEEKNIPRDKVVGVVEAALAAAYKKEYGEKGQNIQARMDPTTHIVSFALLKEVVDEAVRRFPVEGEEDMSSTDVSPAAHTHESDEEGDALPRFNPARDIILSEAQAMKADAQVGDVMEFPLEAKTDFGRVAAQAAKQVIIQRVREAERDAMFDAYSDKIGTIITGTISRIEGRTVFIDMGKATGALLPSEQIESERYRLGQRLKVYVARVESDPRGPGITLSRSHPELVRKLFELEVPEVASGVVEIRAIAREAGVRTKIAVFATEEGVDPVGSCVGQQGTRVNTVVDELSGERVDVIKWSDVPEEFIAEALKPAKVARVECDLTTGSATAVVPNDQLSLAIGRKGQNVRLAVRLTGWKIDVFAADVAQQESPDDTTADAVTVEEENGATRDVMKTAEDESHTDTDAEGQRAA